MMNSTSQETITRIVMNENLSDADKIERLLIIREDCLSVQRAVTEGGMTGDDTLGTDLRLVDEALNRLGCETLNMDDKAATL